MKKITFILLSVLLVCVTSCKDEDTVYNTAAKASFDVSGEYEVGQPITFTDKTAPEQGTKIVSYLWEFGDADESTSAEQSPTFTYMQDGLFTVLLTVTDDNGLKATFKKEIEVVNPTNADFTLDSNEYQMGDEVHFTDATTTKGTTTISAYLWEFGDAEKTTSTEKNPTFVYNDAGAYSVTLTVTDSYGLKSSVTKSVAVFDPSKAIAVLWTSALPGSVKGGSSVALSSDGSMVYMLAGGDKTLTGTLNAYNIVDGSTAWSYNIDKGMQENHDGGSQKAGATDIFGSPSVGANGYVYFVVRDLKDTGTDRRLFVMAVKPDGKTAWAKGLKDVNVYAITPTIDAEGNIYVAQRGNGKIWKFSTDGNSTEYTSAGIADFTGGMSLSKDGTLYATGKGASGFLAYNLSAGADKWIYNTNLGGASEAFNGALRPATTTIGADGTAYIVSDQASGEGGGAIIALNPDGTEKWKHITVGAIPVGGVVLGTDGTIYANGGKSAGENTAGVVALNPDGSLKWHFTTTADAQTVPLVDDRGYVHFITADATYYVVKPDGKVYSSLKIGDSTISSPLMDKKGNTFVSVKKGDANQVVCLTSKAASYAVDSAWPMRGQNPQRTGLQK